MKWIPYLLFLIPGLLLAYTDIKRRILPDVITIPMIITGLIYNLFILYQGDFSAGVSGLIGGLFIFLYFKIILFFMKKEVIGGGDIKLIIAFGFWFGLTVTVYIFIAAVLLSVIFYAIRKVTAPWISWPLAPGQNNIDSPYPVPLGAFLVIAAGAALFY